MQVWCLVMNIHARLSKTERVICIYAALAPAAHGIPVCVDGIVMYVFIQS